MNYLHTYVINLQSRKDRLEHITSELNKLNVKYTRFEAIKKDNGAFGCSLSHINCLIMAIQNKYPLTMICEDDAKFYLTSNEFNNLVNDFYNDNNANVLCVIGWTTDCSGHNVNYRKLISYNDLFNVSYNITTTTCYIVKQNYYKILLENFVISANGLISNEKKASHIYALDQYWKQLQRKDVWVIPKKIAGKQLIDFSNITNTVSHYDFLFFNNTVNYISTILQGRLGNQLFQIAVTYALYYQYNLTPLFSDDSIYFKNIFNNIVSCSSLTYSKIQFKKINEINLKYNEIKLNNLDASYQLNGYFQSPKYFEKYKKQILELFDLDLHHKMQIKHIYQKIKLENKLCVSLHVRRGDYMSLKHIYVNLQKDYYNSAVNLFPNALTLFVIFSDDIIWCKQNLNYPNMWFIDKKYEIDLPQEVVELYLMSLCDHNIIANSSFSWWGAWLNQNPNKQVIAPKHWYVKQNMDNSDIYCDNWTVI